MATKTKQLSTPAARHTPGPWEVVRIKKKRSADAYRIQQTKPRYPGSSIVGDCKLMLAELFAHRFGSADNVPGDTMNDLAHSDKEGCQEANARLMGAAPDLLAACELFGLLDFAAEIIDRARRGDIKSLATIDNVSLRQAAATARAAIAKAKGGQP